MANNITLNTNTDNGAVVATDDVGGFHFQKIKVHFGGDDTATAVTASVGFPVDVLDVTYVDDADWTALTSKHLLIGGIYQATEGTITDGDTGPLRVDVNGHIINSPHAESIALADNYSNTQKVYVDDAGANVPVVTFGYYYDGSTWDRLRGDATNGLLVNLGSNNDITGTVDLGATDNAVLDDIASKLGSIQTALQLIDNVVLVEDAAHSTGASGIMPLAVRNDTLAALAGTDGDYAPLQVDADGALFTRISSAVALDVSAATVTVDGSGVTQPVSGTITANLGAVDNAVLDTIASNTGSIKTAVETLDNAISGSEMQVDIVGALPAGTAAIGKLAANSGVDIGDVDVLSLPALATGSNAIGKLAANDGVDIGDVDVTSISAGSNLIGDVGLSGARTAGGVTPYKGLDVDQTEDEVKGSAGQVYFIHAMNLTAATVYLKFYNATAATVEVGTTTPVLTFPIPTQGDTNGAGFTLAIPNGIEFDTAICIAGLTGIADADTTGVGTNGLVVNLGYA